jgi:probable rRNA maturation factor
MKNEIEITTTVEKGHVDEARLTDLINWILVDEKCSESWHISIIFVDDGFIIELNKKFLQKSGPTDVISFNLTDSSEQPEGEVYISIDTAKKNAQEYNAELKNELYRLTAHGVYHLLDYDDATQSQRDAMTQLENKALEYVQSTL